MNGILRVGGDYKLSQIVVEHKLVLPIAQVPVDGVGELETKNMKHL